MRHGLTWWQVDLTYGTVKALEKLRLASDLLLPDAKVMAAKTVPQAEAEPEPADVPTP
ncbi:hypothetical protein D3C78_1751410 [compost metagenome]